MQEEKEKEKEDIIILEDEITPPYDGSKRKGPMPDGKKWDWEDLRNKQRAQRAIADQRPEWEEERVLGKDGVWKKDNYIIGKRTPEDKQYCEKVDPLDLYNTIEIRKYILAVETYLSKKENERVFEEARYRIWKYILSFVAGGSAVLWALYAGMINLTK